MHNSIRLPDGVIPKAKDGDIIEIMVTGTIEECGDGCRCLSVESVDGEDIPEYEDDSSEMDGEDALTIFIGKLKKKKEE